VRRSDRRARQRGDSLRAKIGCARMLLVLLLAGERLETAGIAVLVRRPLPILKQQSKAFAPAVAEYAETSFVQRND
jgi:hypothetical protein